MVQRFDNYRGILLGERVFHYTNAFRQTGLMWECYMGIYDRLVKCYDAIGIDIGKDDKGNYKAFSLDSLLFIELIVEIETEFNVLISDEYMDVEYFLNPVTLVDIITFLMEKEQ